MLILVRHGRTAANASRRLQGLLDLPLDEIGEAQVAKLVSFVGPVDRVIASPLLRARQTAAVFGRDVEIDDRWRELGYGEFEGRAMSEIDDETWKHWRTDIDFAPGNGETLRQLGNRVYEACDELVPQISARTVVIVSHVTPIKVACAWALGAPLLSTWRSFLDQASICRIDMWGHGPVLSGFNQRPSP